MGSSFSSEETSKQRSIEYKDGARIFSQCSDGKFVEYFYEDAKTLYETFMRGAKISGDGPFLGTRNGSSYSWRTYNEVKGDIERLGSFLLSRGVSSDQHPHIGIYSANRAEWVISMQSCNMFSLVTVPLYDTFDIEACQHIIKQTEMKICICDTKERFLKLLKIGQDLKCIILMDVPQDQIADIVANATNGIAKPEVVSFQHALETGAANVKPTNPPSPDSVAIICYTSGTTGMPKGVVLTHKCVISNIAGALIVSKMEFIKTDSHISYLPLAHMFEQMIQNVITMHGARIGFFSGDVKKLVEDIAVLKPTLFATVPRILNRIHNKVQQEIQGNPMKISIFNWALNWKMSNIKKGDYSRDTLADRLVFNKIQDMMGGNVKAIITGSAPIAPAVLDFIRCAFSCSVYEGYGQTEATAAITLTEHKEWQSGHVGVPVPCCMVKLIDVPELNYAVNNNQGEICVKGCNVMREYYKEPQKTREVLDEDGWLRTGDIGQWLPNGTLKVIDRIKHVFKLSQGEYVIPEKIESIYSQDPLFTQVFVDGNSLETFCIAIAFPDPQALSSLASSLRIEGTIEELCRNKKIEEEVLKRIRNRGKEAKLKGFEQVRCVYLHEEPLTVESGLLTPTQKLKRANMRQHFAKQIEELYKTAPPTTD